MKAAGWRRAAARPPEPLQSPAHPRHGRRRRIPRGGRLTAGPLEPVAAARWVLGRGRLYAYLVFVLPGQTPVSRSKPVAPARSISALTAPNTAPWMIAAVTTSRHVLSWSLALGALRSSATVRQTRLNRAPARTPPSTL